MAGTSVDLLFFPIDTIKTRLQSAQGFRAAGGLSGVYTGVGSVVVGSAPGGSYFSSGQSLAIVLTVTYILSRHVSCCIFFDIRDDEKDPAIARKPRPSDPHDISLRRGSCTIVPLSLGTYSYLTSDGLSLLARSSRGLSLPWP